MCPRKLLARELNKRYHVTRVLNFWTKLDTDVLQVKERLLVAILETINTSQAAMGMAKTHQVATVTTKRTTCSKARNSQHGLAILHIEEHISR